MSSIIRPFRDELKFLVHYSVREMLLAHWSRHLVRAPFTDEHAMTPILSQYYDSPSLDFYEEKLAGTQKRNKVRLRVYDMLYRKGTTAFLEIKHRFNDQVQKYRYQIRDFDPAIHMDPDNWHFDDPVMESSFLTLKERYHLRASAQTYYQREAYEGAVEGDIRVTFDSNLIGLFPGEKLTPGLLLNRSRHLMPETLMILEVKATKGIPGWIHQGIVRAELKQQTIPKYITAVEVLRLHELNGSGVYA